MRKWLQQLIVLSLFEWKLMLMAMLGLPIVALLLRFWGFKQTQAFLYRFAPNGMRFEDADKKTIKKARVIARMVTIAARYGPYHGNCLKKALITWWLLARNSLYSEIKFGVQKEQEDDINAHAWVEFDGINISDPEAIQHQFPAFGN